ncbi:MAG TPA: hypothetical protein PLU46_03420 [Thiotrichales bacterium]|nr:hypothetical protein [Thiotrichales bacterium]
MHKSAQAKMIKDILEATIRSTYQDAKIYDQGCFVEHNAAQNIQALAEILAQYDLVLNVEDDVKAMLAELLNSTIHYVHHQLDINGRLSKDNVNLPLSIQLLQKSVMTLA